MLRARNSSQIDEFSTRRRHENLDVYYISQSYFGLPSQSSKKNSDRIILFKQFLRDAESISRDTGAYDMVFSEFKELCRKAWNGKFNYLFTERTKNKNEGKNRIFNEIKDT